MSRGYRLGSRQPAVDRTRASILAAARGLLADEPAWQLSIGRVAKLAGVSRVTVYNQFGSKSQLLEELGRRRTERPSAQRHGDPREALRAFINRNCFDWSADPRLIRNLGHAAMEQSSEDSRRLAEQLAAGDDLRPGCSIKEAEDVIGALASFPVFDRLHKDGRRPPSAVAEILWRLASSVLA